MTNELVEFLEEMSKNSHDSVVSFQMIVFYQNGDWHNVVSPSVKSKDLKRCWKLLHKNWRQIKNWQIQVGSELKDD